MVLLNALDLTLPFKNPVIIFSIVLFIILFAPILFSKIKVPHIIGLIIAGIIIGPYGFNILRRDASIVLFSTVGLLYIMFLAGLEIDLGEFKKNKKKIALFGAFTSLLPLAAGALAGYYVLGYSLLASLLLGSMLATHTLISYPIASRYGVARNRAVAMTIGGTIIADIVALLIMAGIAGSTREEVSNAFWLQLSISSAIFVAIVFFVFPIIARWFFQRYEDSVSQYIFILAMVFLASFLAEAAGLESIIGALFAGLALNRFVPHSSPLMNRIDFVGNAIFIPFFLISVGMLVDVSILTKGSGALKVAGVIIVVAILTKYIAAWATQKTFKLSVEEGRMIFGLSTSRAAATLAIVLVGYNIIIGETVNGEPIRLLNEDVLNGTILLILISCAISSFVVEKAAKNIALQEESLTETVADSEDKILISLAYPETVKELVDFGLMLRPEKSNVPIYALHVTDDEHNNSSQQSGRKMLDKAVVHASATENTIIPLIRHDVNVSNGIIYTIKEQNISDIVIGLHHNADENIFFGDKAEQILKRTLETIFIYKPLHPMNTLKRMVVVVPPSAEEEPGFMHWLGKLYRLAKEASMGLVFYAAGETTKELQTILDRHQNALKTVFVPFSNWDDFLIVSRDITPNDLFVVVSSRREHPSYVSALNKIPYYLNNYFKESSLVVIYPKQLETGVNLSDIEQADSTLLGSISNTVEDIKAGKFVKRLFGRK